MRRSPLPRDLDFEGKGLEELRVRFLSMPPLDWENCHARIDVGIVSDMIFRKGSIPKSRLYRTKRGIKRQKMALHGAKGKHEC